MRLIGEPQFVEDFAGAPSRLGAAETLPDDSDLDVLAHGQPAEQPHRLKRPHDAGARKAVAGQSGAVAFADDDGAGERPLESREHVDQCGLAGAVRADQAENFAALRARMLT